MRWRGRTQADFHRHRAPGRDRRPFSATSAVTVTNTSALIQAAPAICDACRDHAMRTASARNETREYQPWNDRSVSGSSDAGPGIE